MIEADKKRFVQLLAMLGELYNKNISGPLQEFYFVALQDLEYEKIHKNALNFVNTKKNFKGFPDPGDLRNEETKALESYNIIKEMMIRFYDPTFHKATLEIIKDRLERSRMDYMFPLLQRWGDEIMNGSNPSATRAQFLKSYQTDTSIRKRLPSKRQSEKISENINKIIEIAGENR